MTRRLEPWAEALGMDERPDMRVSDGDREAAVERLRAAHNEGRLNLYEYDDRLARAYQSVTYGDLSQLFSDLPQSTGNAPTRRLSPTAPVALGPSPSAARSHPVPARRGGVAGLPTWLKVLWGIWFTAVSVNLVVWTLVSVSTADLAYFWPMWVAGPYGGVLIGLTTLVLTLRSAPRELP